MANYYNEARAQVRDMKKQTESNRRRAERRAELATSRVRFRQHVEGHRAGHRVIRGGRVERACTLVLQGAPCCVGRVTLGFPQCTGRSAAWHGLVVECIPSEHIAQLGLMRLLAAKASADSRSR
jgi:hypothetical protein